MQLRSFCALLVVQEELERDEGYWWSPRNLELLYERVDESAVTELSFTIPGKSLQPQQLLRIPLAGNFG